jgi:division protein CdvB (Snf7/Vps24/ESCRT-III family)
MDEKRMEELKKALEEKNIKIKEEAKKVEEDSNRDRFAHLQWMVLE